MQLMIFFFSSQVKGFRMKKYPRCVLIDNSTFLVIFFQITLIKVKRSHYFMKSCSEGVCNFVCVQKINDAIMKEYLDRVFSAISTNTELENLQPGIGEYENLMVIMLGWSLLLLSLLSQNVTTYNWFIKKISVGANFGILISR